MNTPYFEPALFDLLSKYLGNQTTALEELTTVMQAMSDKLDEVISAVGNIKISADSINLNTDTLEAIMTNVDTHVQSTTEALNNGLGQVNENIVNMDTHVQSTTQAINNATSVINDRQDANTAQVTLLADNRKYLNPTHIASVAAGDTQFPQNVVLCNITDDNLTVTVTAADDTNSVSVVLAPGWNPIIVKSITDAIENTLVYGY